MSQSTEQTEQAADSISARWFDWVIILAALGVVAGLILRTRMHSPNDRSRWDTVYCLVEHGTYAIDQGPWRTIDRVQINGHFYSSKPPVLPTILAAEYWLLKQVSAGRISFDIHARTVVRILLFVTNWIPFLVFLVLYAGRIARLNCNLWVRQFSLVAGGFGTFLTGFSTTLNNHTIAAFSSLVCLWALMAIWQENRNDWCWFALAGFFAAFTAVNELPACLLLVAALLALLWKSVARTLLYALPCAALPIAGHFYATYQITGGWLPIYADKQAYVFEGSYWDIDESGRLKANDPNSIDSQHESATTYLFHVVLGHHGVISLTPIFLISFIGILRVLIWPGHAWRPFALLAIALTVLVAGFYVVAPQFGVGQRNYGGMCCGFRWLFWLIPQWLLFLPWGLDWKAGNRGFRVLALVALLVSCASSFYATQGPWSRPWIQEWLHYMGWIAY